jgi:diguanylate cyclase (GGDEF)-like protein
MTKKIIIVLLLSLFLSPVNFAFSADKDVVIAVLSPMGEHAAKEMWQPTVDYIAENIPDYKFQLVPMNTTEMNRKVESGEVDFLLTNTGHYVELEAMYQTTRILTLKRIWENQIYSQWGSTIVSLADNDEINVLSDIHGKRIASVSKNAFAGFQVPYRELVESGVISNGDYSSFIFTGFPHNSPLDAVDMGDADVGTVPTGVLEQAIKSGQYDENHFKVINAKQIAHFPFQVSSRLYPLWPLAKTQNASEKLAEDIVAILLKMPPEHKSLEAGHIAGWTVPLDYSDIHNLMKEIRIGPYQNYGVITTSELFDQYWHWMVFVSVFFAFGSGIIFHISKLNRQLNEARNDLEGKVRMRTEELATANSSLKRSAQDEEILGVFLQESLRMTSLSDYLNTIIKLLLDNLDWLNSNSEVCIFLANYENESPIIKLAASINRTNQQDMTCQTIKFGECLCGRAAETCEIVFSSHVDERHEIISAHHTPHGHYCIPIDKEEGNILGVLMLKLPDGYESKKYERDFLKRITNVMSMGISRHLAEEEIEYHAYHDSLTNLPNRRLLMDRLGQEINQSERMNTYGALVYIDLDNFKNLNDSLGHSIGDLLLLQVADRIVSHLRKDDTIARLGGDEFVIVLVSLGNTLESAANAASDIIEKTRLLLIEPYFLNGHEYHTTASFGITLYPKKQEKIDDLLKQADTALYEAKRNGKNTIYFYQRSMQEIANKRLSIERDIRDGISNRDFELYYQPQVNVYGELVGAEALIRWNHPEFGFVSPADFIPIAEESGLILLLGDYVLDLACNLLKEINNFYTKNKFKTLSVNISPKQFKQPDFISVIKNQVERHAIDSSMLMLEITEGVLLENVNDITNKMNELKKLNIKFSIDDFGTGYSSMTYLKMLPIDEIKIDRSFISDLPHDKGDVAIVEAISSMSKHLGLNVIAEGVETDEQRQFLASIECGFFQGYLFDKPLSMGDFISKYFHNGRI